MPKGRGRRSTKTSPYSKTRPVDPVSRSKASSSSISDSPKRASGKDEGVVKIVNYKELSGINQNIEPDEEGNMKLTNTQPDKWDVAAKIQSQVIERDVELRCSDGIVIADQSVLAAVSSFLKEIFNAESVVLSGAAKWPENATGPARSGMIADRRKADLVTLLVPDVDCETMYSILACFYWGFIPLSSTTNEKITEKVQLIKVAWNLLHIDVVISKLEPVDSQLDLPSKQETRLVKNVGRKASTAPTNFRIKQEEDKRPGRQSSRTASYADIDEDDPDDPTPLSNNENRSTSAKVKPENNYTYSMMAIHECILCKGKTPEGKPDKEAMNLTFKDKNTVRKVREHYGKCFYNAGKIFPHVDPEEENADANGKVIDEFGKRYKYQCKVKGCWKQRKDCGYKELAMHNAIEHGILEKILESETEEKYVVLLKQLRATDEREYLKTKPLKCRIRGCPDGDINFEKDQEYIKLQTHYASQHYRAWFVNKDDGGKVRNQKVVEPGRGTVCRNCKDRVYGNEENMMGHYATKHARLADAVLEGQSGISDADGRAILVDLYPDRVGEFDRSRK